LYKFEIRDDSNETNPRHFEALHNLELVRTEARSNSNAKIATKNRAHKLTFSGECLPNFVEPWKQRFQ